LEFHMPPTVVDLNSIPPHASGLRERPIGQRNNLYKWHLGD
jgi:hypothetical protein